MIKKACREFRFNRSILLHLYLSSGVKMSDNEEDVILVELSGIIEKDWFSNIPKTCKFIGLETERPVLQIGQNIFTGEFKDCVGTKVLFEKQPVTETKAAEGSVKKQEKPKYSLKYRHKSCKILDLQKAYISEKTPGSSSGSKQTRQDENVMCVDEGSADKT